MTSKFLVIIHDYISTEYIEEVLRDGGLPSHQVTRITPEDSEDEQA